jgi:hypothetical protein
MSAKKVAGALAVKEKAGALAVMEPWEIELQNKAKAAKASEVVGTPRITHRGGILKIDGKKVDGNKIDVVVLAYGLMNTYFEKEFDPETSVGETPDCYSFAVAEPGAEEKMAPHAVAPQKQSETCAGCKWNEFGSGKGNAKRCSNQRKLLVILPSADQDAAVKAEVRQIAVPPGSFKGADGWRSFLSNAEEVSPYGYPGVIVRIGTEGLDTGAYRLTFEIKEKLDKEQVKALQSKVPSLLPRLSEPFPVIAKKEEEKGKSAPRRKVKGQ